MHQIIEFDTSSAGSAGPINCQFEFVETLAGVEAMELDTSVLILLGFYCLSITKIPSDTPVHIPASEARMNSLDLLPLCGC